MKRFYLKNKVFHLIIKNNNSSEIAKKNLEWS